MKTLMVRNIWLILILIVLLIVTGTQPQIVFADPPFPLPRMPICGDQDGSETPFTLNCGDFIPSINVQTYQVPGSDPVDLSFDFVFREAIYNNELGFFLVDDTAGSIQALQPGDPGYLIAAFNRATIIFLRGGYYV